MLKVHPKPLIFGHRGMSAHAPENTLAAFNMAFNAGADGIELDVQLTADDEVIVFQDRSLRRITGLRENVDELSLEKIKTLDAGKHFSTDFIGEPIPTLREVFELTAIDKMINIELKGSNINLVDRVISLIKEFDNSSQLILSSFNSKFLKRVKFQNPEIKIGLLSLPNLAGFWHRKITNQLLKPDALHVFYRDVNAKMIRLAHSNAQAVNVYTVNDPEEMARLFSEQVDMIMTDDPVLGIKLREKYLI